MEKNGMAYYMKALLFLHLGWAFLSTTSLRDENHAWGRMKHWAHTGTATFIMQFKGLTTITSFHEGWSYTLNHPMDSQQEHQGTVDIQPSRTIHLSSSKLTLPWGVKVRVTYEGVTLFQVSRWDFLLKTETTLPTIFLEEVLPKPSDTNMFSLSVCTETTTGISNMSNLNLKSNLLF